MNCLIWQTRAHAAFYFGPHDVGRQFAKALFPSVLVADVGRWLEGEESPALIPAVCDDIRDLVDVAGGDGHVVREEGLHAVVAPQPVEHLCEVRSGLVELSFRLWLLKAGATDHGGVDVAGEGDLRKARLLVLVERDLAEVVVIEVAVGEAHWLPSVRPHDLERLRVIFGLEQAHLATDELGVGGAHQLLRRVLHLAFDLGEGVRAVDTHLVGVARVVAGLAGKVTLWEHTVGSLAAGRALTQHLARYLLGCRKVVPPLLKCSLSVGIHRAGTKFEFSEFGD